MTFPPANASAGSQANQPVHGAKDVFCILAACVILLFAGAPLVGTSPVFAQDSGNDGATTLPDRPDNREIRVFDNAGVLEEEDRESFEGDLARARGLGLEFLIYTRVSTDSSDQSQRFADQLRSEWAVETSDGADDGIVYVITLPESGAETGIVTMSTGENTFPIRQMDAETLQRIVDSEVAPRVEEGNFLEALYFGIRPVINYAEYTPPDPEPRTSRQETLDKLAKVMAAMLVQVTILGYAIVPVIRERRFTFAPSIRSLAFYGLAVGALGVVTGIVAIAGHSPWPALASLAVVVWAAMGVPLVAGWLNRRRERTSVLRVARHSPARQLHGPGTATGSANG